MRTLIYVGDDERLHFKSVLSQKKGSKILVQFDSLELPESRGWHEFEKSDFRTAKQLMDHFKKNTELKEMISKLHTMLIRTVPVTQYHPRTWDELHPSLSAEIKRLLWE